jgi:hypothetical protein
MPTDPNSKTRVVLAFLFLFVVMIVGAYFAIDLGRLKENAAARERQAALEGIIDSMEVDAALKQHPSNRFLQLLAMANKTTNETSAAIEKLATDMEPPAISKTSNLGSASRSDLEALRRDLKTAEANATSFLPRYLAVLKTGRDKVEKYALSLNVGRDTVSKLMDDIDKRHAETAAFISRMLPARADYYRTYENYVAVLVAEFGTYKVVNGQFVFPFQRTVDRYNVAAQAMSASVKRIVELEEEKKRLKVSQQEHWRQFVESMRS